MMPEIWFPNLGIEIKKLDRIAFSIFNIDIYWYGVIIATGIFLGLMITLKEAKRTGQNTEIYTDGLIYATIFSLIFARMYYVIFSWDYFKDNLTEIFAIRNGGIAIYGAIIGGTLTCLIYAKIRKVSFLKLADTASMGLLIGQILGRWGNFVNREAFGTYTDSLFAMRYLKSQVSNIHPDVLKNVININGTEYIQVHPTFLYESLWNIGILIIIYLYRKKKKFDGELMAIYFIGYGIGRFWIEGLRTDALMIGHTNLAISQVLSLVLVFSFILFLCN
ncbi:MAG: prolipoprotein diacylglyceryl transferase [Eubacteriales bacterium]|nr:prolipoprotein diacylglyceryl transferase [Eubacteriales bacterium]